MKITIIGAGITGLSTALALIKQGLDCEVFEAAPQLNEVGAGIWIQPNAMKVLDYLSIGDKVRKTGFQLNQVELADKNLVSFRNTDSKFVTDELGNKITSIHRARLQKVLFEALPKGTVKLNSPYISHSLINDKIRVEFKEGFTETDVLLGADGLHSKVRKSLFESSTHYSGQTCWRGIANINLPVEVANNGRELWGQGIRFGFASISTKEVYWFAVAKAPQNEKDIPLDRKNTLLNTYENFAPLVRELIENTPNEKILRNDISDLKRLSTWYKENVCLIGDAAHATTPNMGQGACQGIEDAYFLSHYLAKNAPKKAFELFEANRRKKVDYVLMLRKS